jgi:hypothetical protein
LRRILRVLSWTAQRGAAEESSAIAGQIFMGCESKQLGDR